MSRDILVLTIDRFDAKRGVCGRGAGNLIMRLFHTIVPGLLLSMSVLSSASASPLAASTILADFNAVIYTNGSTPSDIEGAAVIGGNFSGATMYNNPTSVVPTGFGALTVFGNTAGNLININDGGSAYVAGTKGAGINFNGGGAYIGAPGYSIADFETPLNALSQSLSQLNATSTLPTAGNNEVIKATPGTNGVAVFNITTAQLAAIPSYQMNLNGASTVIFNVSGSNATFSANDESGTTGANNIIWNFYNASSVNFSTLIAGTVLAPGATVTNNNQIDGVLIANAWNGSGELHDYAFTGTLPGTTSGLSLSDPRIPEPPAIGLLGMAAIALGLVARQRRRVPAVIVKV
jgi:choice-of-anchor A domain-containing protein